MGDCIGDDMGEVGQLFWQKTASPPFLDEAGSLVFLFHDEGGQCRSFGCSQLLCEGMHFVWSAAFWCLFLIVRGRMRGLHNEMMV